MQKAEDGAFCDVGGNGYSGTTELGREAVDFALGKFADNL
jgi:hypothetical protein